jgi:membrane dipeptidase
MKIAREVHDAALVIDTHTDTPQRLLDEDYDLASPLDGGHFNFESARMGNVGAVFFAIWVQPDRHPGRFVQRTLELIDAVHQQAAAHPGRLQMAYSAEDIVDAYRNQKLALLLGIEGGHSMDGSLGILRNYYRLGARYMTLTWTNSNGWADSSGDATDSGILHTQNGLSDFGEEVIHEMNRLGMIVDVSHVADKTFDRVLATSDAPVMASHSCARALCNSPRNLSDSMLCAIQRNDGVVMVNFYSAFLSEEYRQAAIAQKPERDRAMADAAGKAEKQGRVATYSELNAIDCAFNALIPRPPLSVLIDHIDHIAKVAGIDHVGLGSDFDGIPAMPEGIDSAADLPKITAALLQRGYGESDCYKILGGNFMRVFRRVELVASQHSSRSSSKKP